MPYCSKCGTEVAGTDLYCARCGARQPVAPAAKAPFGEMSSRNASLLCYIPLVGWIPAIVVLASARFKQDREARFHAFQGLYLFVAWLLTDWAIAPFFHFSSTHVGIPLVGILKGVLIGVWIFMIVKTSKNETFHLPILGELAERSISEQR